MNQESQRWTDALAEEDLHFLKRFLLSSGSLKEVAEAYGISYPTVRARLDRLIAKVQVAEDPALKDAFRRQLQMMVAEGQLNAIQARKLLEAHRAALKQREEEQ
ncbi:MAG: DUF2089 family protein [Candidatus Hydrogenedentes bacterium]|nr:DUF2089 family protein [Candidatus Hydrogenedentota bacterium]